MHQPGDIRPKGLSPLPQKRQKRGACAARASAAAPRVASGAAHGAQVLGAPSQRCGVTRPGQRALPSYRARFAALQRRGELAPAAVVRARSRAALQRPGRGLSSGRRAGCTRTAASDRRARSGRCGERRAREVREGRRAPRRRWLPWAPPRGAARRPALFPRASQHVEATSLRRRRASSAARRRGSGAESRGAAGRAAAGALRPARPRAASRRVETAPPRRTRDAQAAQRRRSGDLERGSEVAKSVAVQKKRLCCGRAAARRARRAELTATARKRFARRSVRW